MTEQRFYYVIRHRPRDGSQDWSFWWWTDPPTSECGKFKTPERAREHHQQVLGGRWEAEVWEVVARPAGPQASGPGET